MSFAESEWRNFATPSTFSKGIIEFMHDITKNAISSVEDMRKANDEYSEQMKEIDLRANETSGG